MISRQRLCAILLSAWAVAAPVPAHAAQTAPAITDPAVQAAITAAVQHERRVFGGKTPVPAVLVGVWDATAHSYILATGSADLKTHRKLTPADHFRIGSQTKMFVVAVLLQLVDEGKLSLDDPLSRFPIGVTIPDADHITVRQLCQMRTGLFEAFDTPEADRLNPKPDTTFDPRLFIKWAIAQKSYFPPDTGFRYSNTNYLILGLVIESITHRPISEEISARLLSPLHLSHTVYPTNQSMPTPWAHGYALTKTRDWEDISGTIPVSLMGAAGAMISTVDDMRRWIALYVQRKVNGTQTQRALLTCLPTGDGSNLYFGLGIGCSEGWFGFTGGLPGYNTATYYFPEKRLTVVAWATLQAEKPSPGIANAIFSDIARILTPGHVPYFPTEPNH